jgi:hypothetical protein
MTDEEIRNLLQPAMLHLEWTATLFETLVVQIREMRKGNEQHGQIMREYSQQVLENDNERMNWARADRKFVEEMQQRQREEMEKYDGQSNKRTDA